MDDDWQTSLRGWVRENPRFAGVLALFFGGLLGWWQVVLPIQQVEADQATIEISWYYALVAALVVEAGLCLLVFGEAYARLTHPTADEPRWGWKSFVVSVPLLAVAIAAWWGLGVWLRSQGYELNG